MKRIIFNLCGIAAILPTLAAQDSYLAEALRANPEVAAAYETYVAMDTKGRQVRALEEPMLYSEFMSSTRMGPQERSFGISQSFPWPGVLKLRENLADAKARVAFYGYEVKRRMVIEKVGLAAIEYGYLREAVTQANESLGLLRQIKPVIDEKVRAGGSLAVSLRLDVEIAVAEQEVRTLGEQRPGLDAQLKLLLGRDPGSELLPWPDFPGTPPTLSSLDHIKAQLRTHHPRLRLAESEIEGARRMEALTQKNSRPAFTLGAGAIDMGNGGETASTVMLGVKLPFRSGKYRAEREEAAAMTRAAGASLEAIEQALIADAVRLFATQEESVSRLRNYDGKLIPSADQALELTKEDFRNDKASLTDLIEAERVLLDLRLMRARALADAHKAAWQIRALTEPLSGNSK